MVHSNLEKNPIICTSISSYLITGQHAVVITKKGVALAIGENDFFEFKEFTKFVIKDGNQLMRPISAYCGWDFTLYLVSENENNNEKRLAYSYRGITTADPLFLNIGNAKPILLFGGHNTAAMINSDGSVIFIPKVEAINSSPLAYLEQSSLPNKERAISVACCRNFIYVVGLSGRVFESKSPLVGNKLNFSIFESLSDKKIIEVSGIDTHCFAVSENGQFFG